MSKRRSTGVPRYQQKKSCERRRTFINTGQKYADNFGCRVGVVIMPNEKHGPIRMWDNGDNWNDFLTDFNQRIREGTQLIPYKLASKARTENESAEEDFAAPSGGRLSTNVCTNPLEAQEAMKKVSDHSGTVANQNMQVGDTVADCRVSGIAEGGLLDPTIVKAYHALGYPIISMSANGQIVPQSSSGQIQSESPGPSSGKRVTSERLWLHDRRLEPVSSDED